ncbi:MAG: hypothetical protein LBN30_02445 [Oscillospiraceae bacterium]|nr:hypothetical protein [Oscillospiraceae bacterium]
MTEEQVTKAILSELIDNGWTIVAYDFPQSGTGKLLHPNDITDEKNKGGIIPDIIAVRGGTCLFFENKDRVVLADFKKIESLRRDNRYRAAIEALLADFDINGIYYGIGIPSHKFNAQAKAASPTVDFIVGVISVGKSEFLYNPNNLTL